MSDSTSSSAASGEAKARPTPPPSPGKRIVRVEIISDTICPWCCIAKQRLDKAITLLDPARVEVQINWQPFFLDPSLPVPGKPAIEFMTQKFGEGRAEQVIAMIKTFGRTVGVNFTFAGRIGNSLNSHRLVEWSKQFGKTHALMEVLMRTFNEQSKDLADISVLLDCAEKVGLDREQAKKFLEGTELASHVKHAVAAAVQRDITGVPHFLFDGKHVLAAVQDTNDILRIFKRIGVYETSVPSPVVGTSATVAGCSRASPKAPMSTLATDTGSADEPV